jgi:hypothetical protein
LFTLGQRPNWNGQTAKLDNQTRDQWFDTSVFSNVPNFTLSNGPRTIPNVRVPGVSNSDLSFFKNNYFGSEDRYNLQIRVEMFNAFNHPRFDKPDSDVRSGNFGKVTNLSQSYAPRQIQLAAKLNF